MRKQLKVYYAHFMGIYNTPAEERDIATLQALDLKVLNPNVPEIQEECKLFETEDYMVAFDKIFFERVRECDVFAFRPLPDGRIPGGVAMELKAAQEAGKIIIELPCGMAARSMGKDDTREYLSNIGQR